MSDSAVDADKTYRVPVYGMTTVEVEAKSEEAAKEEATISAEMGDASKWVDDSADIDIVDEGVQG